MTIINLSGAVNACTVEDMQQEADRYATNGWTLRDPTTHKVSVSIAVKDVEAFCEWLRSQPADRIPKAWSKDSDGRIIKEPSISFYLDGSEVTGSWTRLRSRINTDQRPAPAGSAPAPRRNPAPVRRDPHPAAAAAHVPPATPAWNANTGIPSNPFNDDDIPF